MTAPTPERDRRSHPGRLIAFSDGVVAIAITLLILPLAEIEPTEGQDVGSFLNENQYALLAFAISFAVIANYWRAHHGLFELVEQQDPTLVRINIAWLACIVFIPFPTALLDDVDGGYATFYIATLTATSALSLLLTRHLARHPELDRPGSGAELRRHVLDGRSSVLALVVALLISFGSQQLGLFALFLLIPAQLISGRMSRRTREPPE